MALVGSEGPPELENAVGLLLPLPKPPPTIPRKKEANLIIPFRCRCRCRCLTLYLHGTGAWIDEDIVLDRQNGYTRGLKIRRGDLPWRLDAVVGSFPMNLIREEVSFSLEQRHFIKRWKEGVENGWPNCRRVSVCYEIVLRIKNSQ